MGSEARGTVSPDFPTKWAEILPESAVLQAKQLVESIYTLQNGSQSGASGNTRENAPASGCVASQPTVLPPRNLVFRALELTPPQRVRVVLLGQDPYPTAGHANGLAFSVNPHIHPFPPSLRNIFKEYTGCFPYTIPTSGDLTPWAERGVLLLNTVLTVREGAARSHSRKGWQTVTDAILRACLQLDHPVVFLLWGRDAQSALDRAAVGCGIDVKSISFTDACNSQFYATSVEPSLLSANTCQQDFRPEILPNLASLPVLTAGKEKFLLPSSHPSPLGAAKPCGDSPPFIGSRPFLRANALLGRYSIDWRL